ATLCSSAHQAVGGRCEEAFQRYPFGKDVLPYGVAHQLFQHGPVGFESIGQGVRTRLGQHTGVPAVGGVLHRPGTEPVDVAALGLGECLEDGGRDAGFRGQDVVLDDDEVVDRVEAALTQCGKAGFLGSWDEWYEIVVVRIDADHG